MISELNERSREIFRQIVDGYLETGTPIGSRTLSQKLPLSLSPATVRNVMADLEDMGLLFAPHASAGRVPTEAGLRLFVDGLLEIGNLTEDERQSLEAKCQSAGNSIEGLLETATATLSGLSRCAGMVMAPKTESPLKHIEFVSLSPGRALVVLVTENGVVENRIIEVPLDVRPSALVEATNFLSARLVGRTLSEARDTIAHELDGHRVALDELTARVVKNGMAVWSGEGAPGGALIVRGQANLLDDVDAVADLEHIRALFEALETKEMMARLLGLTDKAEGVQIFIGADNKLFGMSGCTLIVGPYRNKQERIVGAIGVIGPTRMNYARIIPMVDYTSKLIGRVVG
ncbi:heat-inducible transcriptional repressor HrcA [Varunaivibrio sulfuroxidans]|uniref:Heat-inducible transcription repressor HrcA n=1 Tax=Varunaivibrio sulfuroxidans TaxID=1773489 RepID=A0A4R3JFI8_9PROT|nr:heat-inducible transcriptional repressor HrcA [Varunaivibrio sulfuroxidans]TCS64909.1 heat-inducible transcription repressor HrcA [Varunaivibrio sulfuroxidans]WES29797.1 heat-inducible transcriptional repressor HrcA [Varunaivibrio sulfuroxidans]